MVVAGGALVMGALALVVALVSGSAVLFVTLWSVCWFSLFSRLLYEEIFLVADTVATDGRVLRWSGLRRQGEWPLAEIASVRRGGLNHRYICVKSVTRERFSVYPGKGWQEFAWLLARGCPVPLDTAMGAKRHEKGGVFRWQGGWPPP
jgi:hypothetical protein